MWIHRGLFRPIILFAAIDPGGGGGGTAAPGAQPAGSPTPNAQPGSQGGGQGGGFRETYFQGVPDEVWSQVEPHVRNVQSHLTQQEQRYAALKGYDEPSLQGLAQFAQAFDRDPLGQWMRMAHGLQQAGVLDADLDLEHLASIVSGSTPEPGAPSGGQPPQNGDMPDWAQKLNARLDRLEGGVTKFQTDQRTQVEDAVLKRQTGKIKEALTKAGIPEGSVSEEMVLAAYIANRGNAAAAAKSFIDARTAWLKGFTQNPNPTPDPNDPNPQTNNRDLDLPNGAPTRRAAPRGRGRRGMIDSQTQAAAQQFLKGQGVE